MKRETPRHPKRNDPGGDRYQLLVSALIAPAGNEALIVLAIRQGLIKPYFSEPILHEYAGVLARPKFRFAPDEIEALLDLVCRRGEEVQAAEFPAASPDPDDEKFLACARAAGVEFIVTGNTRDFPSDSGDFQVVTAGELLDRITFEI